MRWGVAALLCGSVLACSATANAQAPVTSRTVAEATRGERIALSFAAGFGAGLFCFIPCSGAAIHAVAHGLNGRPDVGVVFLGDFLGVATGVGLGLATIPIFARIDGGGAIFAVIPAALGMLLLGPAGGVIASELSTAASFSSPPPRRITASISLPPFRADRSVPFPSLTLRY